MTKLTETTRIPAIEWRILIAMWKEATGQTETDMDAVVQVGQHARRPSCHR
jgi:hypothetical protein